MLKHCIIISLFIILYNLLSAQDTISVAYFPNASVSSIIICENNLAEILVYNSNEKRIFSRELSCECANKVEILHYPSGAVEKLIIISPNRGPIFLEETVFFEEEGITQKSTVKRIYDKTIQTESRTIKIDSGAIIKPLDELNK